MKILFTTEKGLIKEVYFPEPVIRTLENLGQVTYNDKTTPFSQKELAAKIKGADVCLTHWSCPAFSEEVLENADQLKMIVHAAGSVADLVTDQVYTRGIKVCSANSIMAQFVAEGVLTDMLCGLRWIPQHAYDMRYQKIWKKRLCESQSLIGAKVGLVGLGTIGKFLIRLLEPFNVQIKVYDPFLNNDSIQEFPQVELASLYEVLEWGDVISIHASLTSETRGLLDAEKLKKIKDGTLLVNTARGAIIDEKALAAELKTGRFHAVLDVYETEPLPEDSPLRAFDNVILLPHIAGITAREQMSIAMIEEIRRFSCEEPLKYEIPYEKYKLMTKEHQKQAVIIMLKTGLTSVTFRNLKPVEIVNIVKLAHLQGIEWGGDIHVPHGDVSRAGEVYKLTSGAGLEVSSYGSYYEVGCEGPLSFEAILETTIALHAPVIRVWAGNRGSDSADQFFWQKVVEDSQRISDLASKAGVIVSFEFHENTLTDTSKSAARLLRAIQRDNCLCYWQSPMELSFHSRVEGMREILPWVSNIHVFHYSESELRPLAEGEAEWSEYLTILKTLPGDHYCLLEFVKEDSVDQFMKDAELLRSFCRF